MSSFFLDDVTLDSVLGTATDDKLFTSLKEIVSEKTLKAVTQDMGFTNMMEIQYKSIRPLLEGRYIKHTVCSKNLLIWILWEDYSVLCPLILRGFRLLRV